MKLPEQAVILCGGLGNRMRPFTASIPKPMIPCNGKPFLSYLFEQLGEQGVRRFALLTGYLAEQIEDYFGDGDKWGWEIKYSHGPVEWDTGRRIWEAQELLDKCFLLLYSDNFVLFQLERLFALHAKNNRALTLIASKKSPGNISIDKKNLVKCYKDKRDAQLDFVEIGYMIAEKTHTLEFFEIHDCSFSSILSRMAAKQQISAWVQHDTYHSISDPERWKIAEEYLKPKKILLIDRDGVINRKAQSGDYIRNWENFEYIPENIYGMRQLAKEGFKFIVISNQAGIARGLIEPIELDRIHLNLKEGLSHKGIEIIEIYVCPHHWDEGCFCRKPNPGLIFKASKDHLFRVDQTLFIGDDIRDFEAANNAGCKSFLLIKEDNNIENNCLKKMNVTYSLDKCVEQIVNLYKF